MRSDLTQERIYQFILQDKKQAGELYKHLHHQKKHYRKRYGSPKRQGSIRNRRFINERPAIVNEKSRLGDWVEKLENIMKKLNSRTRKTLGFMTPNLVINL